MVGLTRTRVTLGLLISFVCVSTGFPQITTKEIDLRYESIVLVRKGQVEITLADFVAYMDRRVPAEDQRELVSSAARIEGVLENIALTEAFMERAHTRELTEDVFFRARLYQAAAREARDAYREILQAEVELPDYESQAREMYLLDPNRFIRSKTVDIEQIVISVGDDRNEIDAMKRVIEAYELLMNGEDFTSIAASYSDDPTFTENQGVITDVDIRDLVPSVAAAVEVLEVGELSSPVQSRFGWHILRIIDVHQAGPMTWEQAQPIAEGIARNSHLAESFERILREINSAPMQFAEGAVRTILDHYGADGFGVPKLGEGSESDESAQ